MAPKLSLVIPVYNEAASLEPLLAEIDAGVADVGAYEIVFIDDGSTDGSFAEMERLAAVRRDVRIVKLRRNFGKSAALAHGFAAAAGEIIVTLDGDRQDDPREIPKLLAKLDSGFDLVSGWKQSRQDPATKTVPSRLFNWTVRRTTGIPLHDFNCGFKAYRRVVGRDRERLWGAAPLHPGRGRPAGLSRDRGAGRPPPPDRRTVQVRLAALHAGLSGPAHGALPGSLPQPPAAPLRRGWARSSSWSGS